jgi:hypothetical protein
MLRATIEYIAVSVLGLTAAYLLATAVSNAVSDRFNQTGDLIGNSITYHG